MPLSDEKPESNRALRSRSIQRRVLDSLRDMIVGGELPPGAALSEVGLSESFGISRTPVREALKQLQAEGLVEIRPQVGTFVAKPSRREVGEMSRVREVLEGLAANLMAQRGSIPELDALRENVKDSEISVGRGKTARYAQLVGEFHGLILAGSDNRKLQEHYLMLTNQLAYPRLVRASLTEPGRPERSVAEHRRILEMIEAKDPEGAERAMREHVRSSHIELMRALALEAEAEEPV
jgi:DNA-binding GntR family transcriptional regulator